VTAEASWASTLLAGAAVRVGSGRSKRPTRRYVDRSTTASGDALSFVPGDPISRPSADTKAPLKPVALRVEIVGSGSVVLAVPAVLSNVGKGDVAGAALKLVPVILAPLGSKRLTESPPLPR